jgi:hypothetical protein
MQPLSNFVLGDVAITFLAVALARQSGFDSLLLTRLQIESMSLYFLNDVLLQNFALEPSERVLKGFTILNVDLGQRTSFFMAKGRLYANSFLAGRCYPSPRCRRRRGPHGMVAATFFGLEVIGGADIAISSAAKNDTSNL